MNIQELPGLDHSVEEHREEYARQEARHTHNAGEQLRQSKDGEDITLHCFHPQATRSETNVLVNIQGVE